jgi:hypothetical protein
LAAQGKKNLVTVTVYPAFSDGAVDLSSVSDDDYEGPLKLREPLIEQLEFRTGVPLLPNSENAPQVAKGKKFVVGSTIIPLAIVMVVEPALSEEQILKQEKNKKMVTLPSSSPNQTISRSNENSGALPAVIVTQQQQKKQQTEKQQQQPIRNNKILIDHMIDGVDPLQFASDDTATESEQQKSHNDEMIMLRAAAETSRRLNLVNGEEQHDDNNDDIIREDECDNDQEEEEQDHYGKSQKRTTHHSPAKLRRLDQLRRENIAKIERQREDEERKKREKAALYEKQRQEQIRLAKDIKHQAELAQNRQRIRELELEKKKKLYEDREQDLAKERKEFNRRLEEFSTLAQIETLKARSTGINHNLSSSSVDQASLNNPGQQSSNSQHFFTGAFSSKQIGEKDEEKTKLLSQQIESDLDSLVRKTVKKSNENDQNMNDLEAEREKQLLEVQNRRGLNVLLHDLGKKKVESSKTTRKQIIDYQEVLAMLKR